MLAFLVLYLVWGSTYLAIRIAVETLPPFLMAGGRFALAGVLLWAFARPGQAKPTREHWRAAAMLGGFLIVGGNGLVCWGEQYIPSGLTALTVSCMPIWMALLEWLLFGGRRPGPATILALAMGIGGVALLVGPIDASRDARTTIGFVLLVVASLSWAYGSLRSRNLASPSSALLGTAMQMMCGGGFLIVLGLVTGEAWRVDLAGVSSESALAVAYLVVFGSIGAFTTYVWLMRHASPIAVSTYAFVNPLVAVVLGWAVADEALRREHLFAAVLIVAAVALMIWVRSRAAVATPVIR